MKFFDYVKAAFNQKKDIPGLGPMPLNKMFLFAMAVLGVVNPGFWFLGIAGEVLYLSMMASNKNYQKLVQGSRMGDRKEMWSEKQAQILKGLDKPSHQRYDQLVENCSGILKITGSDTSDPDSAAKDLRISGLNRLMWMFLKLLSSRLSVNAIIARTKEEELQKEIEELSEKMAAEPESSPLRRSLEGTLDIQQRRMENLKKAKGSIKVIDAELDRIEKQVTLLKEEASVNSDPELVSVRLDGVMDSLSGTNRWMSEQSEIFGFLEESSMPDELLSKPKKKKLIE